MKNYGVILGSNFLTVIADKAYSITTSDSRFAKAVDFVKNKKWGDFFTLMDKPAAIARCSKGAVKVYNNEIHYNDKVVHGVIAERILKFMNDGFDFAPLVAFLNNLYANTDENVRDGLYRFLENNQLAITERGSFLAYKLVRDDGTPIYHSTGTFQNEAGKEVRNYEVGQTYLFPRNRIVKTSNECSTEGLYVGNKNYWNGAFDEQNNYTGKGKMLIVEIYPQDVCNVPHADATKIVVCKLKVVDEYKTIVQEVNSSLFEGAEKVESADWLADFDEDWKSLSDLFDEPVSTSKLPKRDAKGKFVKRTLPLRDAKGHFIAKKSSGKVKRDAKGRFRS